MKPMFAFRSIVSTLILAAAASAPEAMAQTSTGTIRGTVRTEDGEGLGGASVAAQNFDTNLRRGMLTEQTGFYNLGGLPPGNYEVTFSHPSYAEESQQVVVQTGQVLEINPRLSTEAIQMAGIRAVLEVPRIIELKTPEVATNITRQQIENLPLLNRNFLDFAALAPGIRRTPSGQGLTAGGLPGENINLFIDGASFKSDVLTNGIVGQDASAGNPFPQNAVREFRVITQNFKAEYRNAAAAVITATTKSGTNAWEGSAFFLGQSEGLIAKNVFQRCEAPLQGDDCVEQDVQDVGRQQFGGTLGGPIVEDQAFVFGSYEGNYRDIPQTVNVLTAENIAALPMSVAGIPVRDVIADIEGTTSTAELRADLFFGKFTYQPGEQHRVETSLSIRDEFDVRGFGGFNAPSRAEDFNNDVITAIGSWQYFRDRLLNDLHVDFQRFHWNPMPLNVDQPGLVFQGILAIGGGSTEQDFQQDRLEIRDDVTYTLPDWGGEHVFKSGAYLAFLNYDVTKFLSGNPNFEFRQAENFAFPFEAFIGFGDPNISHDNTQYGLYVQDDWSPSDRLTLNLGLRWDVETNMLNNDWVTPDSVRQDVAQFLTPAQQMRYFTDGDDRDPYYGAVQPRFGFTYDVTGDERTVVFGGAGIFYDRTFFNAGLDEQFRLKFPRYQFRFSADGSLDAAGNPTIMWSDAFLSRQGLLGIINEGNLAAKPEVFLIANDTKPPMARQWTLGVRQAVGPVVVSANYTGVQGENIFTWIAGNRRPNGSCCLSTDRFGTVLISTDEAKTWYDALMLQLGKPFTEADRWGAQISYTLAEAEQNFGDLFTFDVLSESDLEGQRFPSGGDIRHSLTGNWIVSIPWDIRFSGIANFRSSPPIHARVGNDPNNSGIGGDDFVNDEGPFSRRPEDGAFREVNIRFEKGFAFGIHRVAVLAEVFNLFDNENYRFFNDFFGNFNRETMQIDRNENWGKPTGLFPDNQSRRLQLGARYEFF